jgi:hypothetical protein
LLELLLGIKEKKMKSHSWMTTYIIKDEDSTFLHSFETRPGGSTRDPADPGLEL